MSGANIPGGEVAPVGFIGLGNIGAPMARRLLAWPGGLMIHDVVPAACEPLEADGAIVAASPAEMAERCRVISVMVQTEAQVADVLGGDRGILTTAPAATVVVVHSTISPSGAIALAATAARHGVDLLDAPVSGGAMGAYGGTLAFMVGGDAAAVERCRPVLDLMGSLVIRFGAIGAGTTAKVARNLITFASYAAVGEAQRLAEAAGLDVAALGDVVRHSDAVTGGPGAIMIRPTAAPMDADDPLRPIFAHTSTLGGKDLDLAIETGRELDVATPVAALAADHLDAALGLSAPPAGP